MPNNERLKSIRERLAKTNGQSIEFKNGPLHAEGLNFVAHAYSDIQFILALVERYEKALAEVIKESDKFEPYVPAIGDIARKALEAGGDEK